MANDKQVVDLEALEQDEDLEEGEPDKFDTLMKFVESKLSKEDFAALQKEMLGSEDDLSNKDLLAAIKELVSPKEKPKEEDMPPEDETEMADQQTFMEECLKGGKSREECLAEYKKKAPEPPAEEGDGAESELAGKVAALEKQLGDLKKEKELAEVSTQVEKLIAEKHLAPVQREMAVKLASGLDAAGREGLYTFWTKTQRFNVDKDIGLVSNVKPGTSGITPERRAELIKLHGLGDLIQDKADKTKMRNS